MKGTLALLVVISSFGISRAQFSYKNSTGIRLGHTTGLTYKHFVNRDQSMEFIASSRNEGFQITSLYLFHKPLEISFNEDFYFFYGVGGHVGFERFLDQKLVTQLIQPPSSGINEFDQKERSFFTMGVNTVIGIEYRWLKVPVTIGLDIKPYLDFIGMRRTKFRFWDTALSFKYIF